MHSLVLVESERIILLKRRQTLFGQKNFFLLHRWYVSHGEFHFYMNTLAYITLMPTREIRPKMEGIKHYEKIYKQWAYSNGLISREAQDYCKRKRKIFLENKCKPNTFRRPRSKIWQKGTAKENFVEEKRLMSNSIPEPVVSILVLHFLFLFKISKCSTYGSTNTEK